MMMWCMYDDVMYTVWCSAYSEGGPCLEQLEWLKQATRSQETLVSGNQGANTKLSVAFMDDA